MEAFLIAEYVGIASAALSGFLFGIKRGCDWLGVFLAAFLTALGGGLMRDVIVGRPAYSFTHFMPVLIVLCVMVIAILFKLHHEKRHGLEKKFIFIMTDAVDVISFSIVGAIVSIEYGLNIFGVILVAFFNGVGGGILRDVLLNEVPWFLKTGLYGTISMAMGFIYYFMDLAGFTNIYWVMLLFVFGIIFRLVAYYKNWGLPQIHYKE
ncbi:hypothetical membrane protein (UPF0126 domain) [Campylobacter iguaniorum]|uniref:Hypothetical membrane protein (UPF0126 domain) n=1 Tax=Campylobacter iguaniorum TaxID=1244531 RepID=A0A076FBT1_9BACT|nr:TRIC cation channel family protein [Campylobacter iguaniorum]AII14867.1 hypothetical membrane protein (UPF0126 domain) [Campylobacter iguaniorum]ALV24657.1 hypothetical membrane protein (UPF0126 domain) [Campylobacter iguaniorum]ANE36015.1 hypothetical membrane protein (UPF0126 domain) [Campylobacter iguaniorum]